MRLILLVRTLLAGAVLVSPGVARDLPVERDSTSAREGAADRDRVAPADESPAPPRPSRSSPGTRSYRDEPSPSPRGTATTRPPLQVAMLDPNIDLADRDLEQAAESFDPFTPYGEEPPLAMAAARPQTPFQAASLSVTRIIDDSFSITDIDTSSTWAFPLSEKTPLVLTPGFGVHFFSTGDAPGIPTLPNQVYDFYMDVRLLYRHSERWTLDLAVTPGWYSDLENNSSDALRIGARALSIATWSPTLKVIGGIVYLDRDDFPFVPGAGLIWTPNEDVEIMAAFPKPKAAYRIDVGPDWSRWVYLAGEFGGGAWAANTPATPDVISYSDLRLILGMEQRATDGPTFRVEAGYVFARRVEFSSGAPNFDPGDAFMIRGALAF